VLPLQARYLLWALKETESVDGCVVEVGAWRGATTEVLARQTESTVVAIDPWIGESNEYNMAAFLERTRTFPNVNFERSPFGIAARDWRYGAVRFIFIDAAHDYVNVAHDLAMARWLLNPGGMIALHDTDNSAFPGCRRAVFEVAEQFDLAAHIDDLTILKARN
jgi:predicted O-methyltransferase YrrM